MTTSAQILSLRLSQDDARLVTQLHAKLGLSKSDVVKRALRIMAFQLSSTPDTDAFSTGIGLFGRYGDVHRQSADIKQMVRQRIVSQRAPAE